MLPVVSPVVLQRVDDDVRLIISGAADAKRRAAGNAMGERNPNEIVVRVSNITMGSHCPVVAGDILKNRCGSAAVPCLGVGILSSNTFLNKTN